MRYTFVIIAVLFCAVPARAEPFQPDSPRLEVGAAHPDRGRGRGRERERERSRESAPIPVSEPGTLALLSAGLVSLYGARKKLALF